MPRIKFEIYEDDLRKSKFYRQTTAQKPSTMAGNSLIEEKSDSRKMETANSRRQAVKIYVRSKKVAIRSVVIENYTGSIVGPVKLPSRFVDYEDRLDETQQTMVDYASDLALSTGLPIKVVDVSKLNVLERFGRVIFRRVRETPAIELPEAMFLHMRECDPPKIWEGIGIIPK